MKSSFIKLGLIVTLVGLVPFVSYGASGEATTSEEQTGATQEDSSPLLLESITVQDDMNILVQFNQKIVSEAVRVRITKQSDGSNISVDKVVSVVDTPMSVLVVLSSVLEE
jgi:hypothetical protein